MICPDCLEDYEFIDFDIDSETMEHQGVFRCACYESNIFSEATTREMISDEDLKERLRISRLLYIRKSLTEKKKLTTSGPARAISLKMKHLQLYIQHFSEQSIRQLK